MSKLIPYDDIKRIIIEAHGWMKAYLALQYASASRMGELIAYTHRFKTKANRKTDGLLKKNFNLTENYIEWKIPQFKRGKNSVKECFVLKEEEWLYEIIKAWLEICKEQVLPYKIAWSNYTLNGYLRQFGYTTHDLRHSRATHLVTKYGYGAFEIKDLLGHAKLESSAVYVHQTRMKEKIQEYYSKTNKKKPEFETKSLI